MSTKGEAQLHAIQEDLACPQCEYNLRGLYGEMVNCPECGRQCDITELIKRQWKKPWYHAPGMSTLALPAGWCLPGLVALQAALEDLLEPNKAMVGAVLWAFVWSWLIYRAAQVFDHWQGAALSLLLHVVLLGYLIAVVGSVVAGAMAVGALIDGNYASVFFGGPLFVCFMVLVAICRLGDRYVATQCIRRWLNKPPED